MPKQPAPLTYFGKVTEDGTLELPKKMGGEIRKHFAGRRIQITLKVKKKPRSNSQNGYYWGCVIPLVLQGFIDLGHEGLSLESKTDREAIHEFLKAEFAKNGREICDAHGNVIQLAANTSGMSTVEFESYLFDVRQWAAEMLGVQIPEPNEQAEFRFG